MIEAAILTVLIETILFFLYGYRQKTFLYIVMLANLLTNVSLNLAVFLSALFIARQILPGFVIFIVIAVGETAAVAVEYVIYNTYLNNNIYIVSGKADADNNPDADAVEIAGAKRKSRQKSCQKHRLFLQVLLSNAVSFGIGLLLLHFAG